MIAVLIAFVGGIAFAELLGRGVDLGIQARRERDTAVGALHQLIVAMHARGRDQHSALREARAWARARSVLAALLRHDDHAR